MIYYIHEIYQNIAALLDGSVYDVHHVSDLQF